MLSKNTSPGMDSIAIHVEHLGKMYTLYNRPVDRLKHSLFWRFGKSYGHPFWALHDVSFEVRKGETLGVIGRNGSGKSTLLQILAGTTHATSGKVTANGRVAALLELGSGFNPEFTGRENVFLNGMILGISREEMVQRYDEIAAFADIGEFIDQPVKLYSSGMFVRLAFAVAASVDADILLIDEALAVGDIFFRQKCYRRLEDLRDRGVSIVLVSHAMNEVEQFCEHGLLLKDGEMNFLGPAIEAVKRYYFIQQSADDQSETILPAAIPERTPPAKSFSDESWPGPEAFLNISRLPQVSKGLARCSAVAITDQAGRPCLAFQQGQTAHFFFEFELFQNIGTPIGGAEIINDRGIIVHGKNSLLYGAEAPEEVYRGSLVRFHQEIVLEIQPGEYTFNIGFSTIPYQVFIQRANYNHPDLDANIKVLCILPNAGEFAVISRKVTSAAQLMHFGLANLPGRCQIAIAQQHPSPSPSLDIYDGRNQ